MTQFPYDLVDQIVSTKSAFQEKIEEAQAKRKGEIDQLSKEIGEISAHHDDAIRSAQEAHNTLKSDKKSDSLQKKKKELQRQKEEYIKKIQCLQQQIQKIQSESNSINYSASLALIKSIAPVRFTTITPNRLAGVISFGTPQSTESFDFNRSNPEEIPEKFWKKLLKCSNARYVVEQNTAGDWCNNDQLAW